MSGLHVVKECDKICVFGEKGDLIKAGKILVWAANCPLMASGEHEKIFDVSDLYTVKCPRATYASDHMEEIFA